MGEEGWDDDDNGEVSVRGDRGEIQEEKEPSTRMKHKAIICKKQTLGSSQPRVSFQQRASAAVPAATTHHQAGPRLGGGHFTRMGNDFP